MTAPPVLWRPSRERVERATITAYTRWLEETRGLDLPDYASLWEWSTTDLEGFWASIWERFDVVGLGAVRAGARARGRCRGRSGSPEPGSTTPSTLLRARRPTMPSRSATRRSCGRSAEVTRGELRGEVARLAGGLRALGVGPGDRVAAYLPNIPEAVAAFLACASIGAVWSSCSPDFGARSVIDRFAQIEPKVLLAVDGYRYGGKDFDRLGRRAELLGGAADGRAHRRARLPRPRAIARRGLAGAIGWDELCGSRRRSSRSCSSSCRSTIRSGCSTARARRACRRRSCTATAGSCSRC